MGNFEKKLLLLVRTGKSLSVSSASIAIFSVLRILFESSPLHDTLKEVVADAFYFDRPLLSFVAFILVTFLVIDLPLFYFPAKWIINTRQIKNLNFFKFYTLYVMIALCIYPWASALPLAVIQFISLYKIMGSPLDKYFLPSNFKIHWHLIFLLVSLVSIYIRLLFISLGS